MDIKYLKTFIKVAECRSFTKAAEELNYVQSTVTMQIKQLEKELSFPLFDRIGRSISLTAAGKEFLSLAYEMLNMMDEAEAIGTGVHTRRGRLRIGVSESLLFSVITDLLPLFKSEHPDVSLNIKTGHRVDDLFEDLKQNRLDIVYASVPLNTEPAFCSHYVRKERLIFVCGEEHPLALRKNIPLRELMEYDFLVTEREGTCNKRLRTLAAEHGTVVKDVVEIDNVFVIASLAEKGMGLAFLPEYCVTNELKTGRLKKLDVAAEEQPYYSQLICHKRRWVSPVMRDFIEFIRNERPENLTSDKKEEI